MGQGALGKIGNELAGYKVKERAILGRLGNLLRLQQASDNSSQETEWGHKAEAGTETPSHICTRTGAYSKDGSTKCQTTNAPAAYINAVHILEHTILFLFLNTHYSYAAPAGVP